MNIHPIKAFSDNYIWLIEKDADILVVDPGESSGVLAYLKESEGKLKGILLTHKHADHTGGVEDIVSLYPDTPVYGPEETASLVDHVIKDGDTVEIIGEAFKVFKTAGHTEEHISFLVGEHLFCGDALFSGGCGRVFTGDYSAQYDALQKFHALDSNTHVYAAHEYTETNLRFALTVEPSHTRIQEELKDVKDKRSEKKPTLPSTIGKEKEINLFLQAKTLEEFILLRQARDSF